MSAAGSADDIRDAGWMVAVHNDYRQSGEARTFWLFTSFGVIGTQRLPGGAIGAAVQGEAATDAEALNIVRHLIGLPTL